MIERIQHISKYFFHQHSLRQRSVSVYYYLLGSVLLLACGIKLYYGIEQSMDIQFADEAAYIRFGLDLFEQMNRNWGPLYSLWYKLLSFITTDTITLYYLNFQITSVLIGILLYFFLLRLSIHPVFALLTAFSVLVSDLNISVWPRISHFCIVLTLFALIWISYLKNVIYKCLVFTMLCLICSYARPEFYLSFILMLIVSFACIYSNRKSLKHRQVGIFIFCLLLISILHIIFRFPSNDFFGYNRGVAAFYQHYAWNYKWRTHATFDAWLYWEDLAKQQFGDCNSMFCVIKSQPGIFISNTLFNIRTYFLQLLKTLPFIFPIGIFHGKKLQLLLSGLILLLFVVLLFRKKSRSYFVQQMSSYRFYLLLLFCLITPTLMSCVAVFPRDHYLYLQMPFFILMLLSTFGYFFKHFTIKPIWIIVFGFLLFLSTPSVKNYSFLKVSNDTHTMCNKKLVRFLEKSYADDPHTLFTNMPFVRGMLPDNFREINTIFDKKKHRPFSHYLDSAKIDIVIIIPSLFRDPRIKSDSSWMQFINHYEDFGFKKQNFTDCDMYLLAKQAPKTLQ